MYTSLPAASAETMLMAVIPALEWAAGSHFGNILHPLTVDSREEADRYFTGLFQ